MAHIIAQYANKASSQSPDIEVIDQYVLDMRNLRAFVKVRVRPWILHACRVIQQHGQPGRSSPTSNGCRKSTRYASQYFTVLTCAILRLDTQIKRAILAAYAQEGNYGY